MQQRENKQEAKLKRKKIKKRKTIQRDDVYWAKQRLI